MFNERIRQLREKQGLTQQQNYMRIVYLTMCAHALLTVIKHAANANVDDVITVDVSPHGSMTGFKKVRKLL